LRGCRNILACLQAYGAPGPALRAAYALEKSGLVGTYVSSFAEYGAVDLVSVGYPYNTGGTIEYALVNGQPEAVAMRDSDVLSSRINDSGYQELRRTYPRALIVLAPRLESYRLMPDGGSRFVFAYPVTTGCQTCAPVGQVLMAYDFSGEGKFLKLHPLAYAQADGELHRQVRRTFSVNELTDDTALVQRRLNGLGYEAGPVDGVSGRRTEQAIAYFQTDHGLPATGEIDQATVKLLASDDAARHVRRFETLLAQGGPGTDRFGLGLLSRFQQLPNHTHLQLATLMNNVAGQLQRTGGYDEALARLSQAERLAVPVRAAQPALYSALLWNQAAIHLAMGDRESADDALRRAREALPQDGASFTVAAEALSGLERTKAALAALRNHLTDIATDGTNAAVRLKSLSAADGTDAHIYTLQYSSAEPRKI
jgi:hypothetical protein